MIEIVQLLGWTYVSTVAAEIMFFFSREATLRFDIPVGLSVKKRMG